MPIRSSRQPTGLQTSCTGVLRRVGDEGPEPCRKDKPGCKRAAESNCAWSPRPPIIRFGASVHEAARKESYMAWTKPEFTVVAVTLEVTAYAGKR